MQEARKFRAPFTFDMFRSLIWQRSYIFAFIPLRRVEASSGVGVAIAPPQGISRDFQVGHIGRMGSAYASAITGEPRAGVTAPTCAAPTLIPVTTIKA